MLYTAILLHGKPPSCTGETITIVCGNESLTTSSYWFYLIDCLVRRGYVFSPPTDITNPTEDSLLTDYTIDDLKKQPVIKETETENTVIENEDLTIDIFDNFESALLNYLEDEVSDAIKNRFDITYSLPIYLKKRELNIGSRYPRITTGINLN